MKAEIAGYARIILEALWPNTATKETLGRRLVVYVGREEYFSIRKYADANSIELSYHCDSWHFMGCELVEVSRDSWFEVAFKGQFK